MYTYVYAKRANLVSFQNGDLYFYEENKNKEAGCYYMFELKHKAACPVKVYTLSAGSIICIV